jgi:hypothetical protein
MTSTSSLFRFPGFDNTLQACFDVPVWPCVYENFSAHQSRRNGSPNLTKIPTFWAVLVRNNNFTLGKPLFMVSGKHPNVALKQCVSSRVTNDMFMTD